MPSTKSRLKRDNPRGTEREAGDVAGVYAPRLLNATKRIALVVFAVFVVGSFVVVAAASGIGGPSVPDGAIAVVEDAPDGTISQEDYDRAIEQTAARQGLKEVPAEDDPQFELLSEAAISDLVLSRWVRGEAEDRGIEVTETEIDDELETVKEQQFGSEEEFQKFLDDSGFTLEEARERIALQLVSDQIQQAVLPKEPPVSEDEIKAYYEENPQQFEQPETRDVRVVLTETESDAEEALGQLQQDDSAKGFTAVAKEFSIDEATKDTGGLRQAVVEGQSEPALDEQIFAAPEGELVGPFETEAGFYVIRVEKITPAATTSLEDATEQIRQTLLAARQQQIATAFQDDFQSKWVSRTFCAEGYRIDRCANADPPPSACTEKVADTDGCDAPVPSIRPIPPGTAGVFGAPAPTGLPQGPITPQAAVPANGLPPGLQTLPGGAAPAPGTAPQAAPPGTAPPGTAPPGTPPPGG